MSLSVGQKAAGIVEVAAAEAARPRHDADGRRAGPAATALQRGEDRRLLIDLDEAGLAEFFAADDEDRSRIADQLGHRQGDRSAGVLALHLQLQGIVAHDDLAK